MRGLRELPSLEALGLAAEGRSPLLERKRSITRYRITERIFAVAEHELPKRLPPDCVWASEEEVDSLPFSGPHRKWVDELLRAP